MQQKITDEIVLRQETQDDFTEVFDLIQLAFGRTNEAKLVDALRNNTIAFIPALSIVATLKGKVVGHISFTKIKIVNEKAQATESLALAPVAVPPEFQKIGIGSRLIQKGLEAAKDLGFKSVIVLGNAHYYPKFGFAPAEKWNIQSPYDVPSNVFMAIELVKNGLKNTLGIVNYLKEFESA